MILIRINENNLSEYLTVSKDDFFVAVDRAVFAEREDYLEDILKHSDKMTLHDYGLGSDGYFMDVYLTR